MARKLNVVFKLLVLESGERKNLTFYDIESYLVLTSTYDEIIDS